MYRWWLRSCCLCIALCGRVLCAPAQYWVEVPVDPPADMPSGARFGAALALADDMLLVGAPEADAGEASSGLAVLYGRYHGGVNGWGELARFAPLTPVPQGGFGTSVHLSGDLALIGAPGEVNVSETTGGIHVYQRHLGGNENWGLLQRITIDSLFPGMRFGEHFRLAGDVLLVDCPGYDENRQDLNSGNGALVVFERDASGLFRHRRFIKGGSLVPTTTNRPALSGWFAVHDQRLVYTSNAYKAYSVPLQAVLTEAFFEPEPLVLTDTYGYQPTALEYKGVVSSDDHLIVDVQVSPPSSPPQLVAFVNNEEGALVQAGRMRPDTLAQGIEWWGWGQALHTAHDRVVVGAFGHEFFTPLGHAEVFTRDNTAQNGWRRIGYLVASDPSYGDQFGKAARSDDEIVVIGAPGYGDADRGRVYVYLDPNVGSLETLAREATAFCWPVPVLRTSGILHLSPAAAAWAGEYTIHDMQGRLLRAVRSRGSELDVSGLEVGAYTLVWRPVDRPGPMSTRFIIAP